MPESFDVFLSYNAREQHLVADIASVLHRAGLRVWIDTWELRPGLPWQEAIEEGIRTSRAVAIFVGASGLGPWQEPEMRAFLARSRTERIPVIPVLLPGSPDSADLTMFLQAFTVVDLRPGVTEGGIERLVWGITGKRGDAPIQHSERAPGRRPRAMIGWWIAAAGVVLVALGWTVWHFSARVAMYSIRVQVLDPRGHPVDGATVRTSVGNEPQRLLDGWWEIEVPAAKVPAGGVVSLWAEHQDWDVSRADVRLSRDPNPTVAIGLREPRTAIRGLVLDENDCALQDVRVSRQDGAGDVAVTDANGRFELRLSLPRDTKVRLRAERRGLRPGDEFCYAGRDNCSIILEK